MTGQDGGVPRTEQALGASPWDAAADAQGLRLGGVHYSWAFFEAMGRRLPGGTRLDVELRPDGTARLFHFRPGAPGAG